jgi:hypothetical protein
MHAIHKLMERETAGDPISGLKWIRKSTGQIARQLKRLGIAVGRNTVGRLLSQMKYSYQPQDDFRRFYFRSRPTVPLSPSAAGSVREARQSVADHGCQKRELIGNFKNPGVK